MTIERRVAGREFQFVVQCCRTAFDGGEEANAATPSERLDWLRILRLARFHRVQGLVWNAIAPGAAQIPRDVASALSADAAGIAVDNLRAAVASRELLAKFEGGGIPVLFVKGLTLGALAYGNAAQKAAVDIDLLVAHDRLAKAAALLQDLGYRMAVPAGSPTPGRLRAWHARHKESVWTRAEPRASIDLHTRLADHPRLIPSVGMDSPRQQVEVSNGIQLPTLRLNELFAYLCVHGSSSVWFRLKWITDLAALLHRRCAGELDALYKRSQELGAGRAAAQALLLADALYRTLDDHPGLRRELGQDRANRWLFQSALRQLAGRDEPIEPTSRPWGTAAIHLTQFLLLPGWRFKASELARQARASLPSINRGP